MIFCILYCCLAPDQNGQWVEKLINYWHFQIDSIVLIKIDPTGSTLLGWPLKNLQLFTYCSENGTATTSNLLCIKSINSPDASHQRLYIVTALILCVTLIKGQFFSPARTVNSVKSIPDQCSAVMAKLIVLCGCKVEEACRTQIFSSTVIISLYYTHTMCAGKRNKQIHKVTALVAFHYYHASIEQQMHKTLNLWCSWHLKNSERAWIRPQTHITRRQLYTWAPMLCS
jgi:hypothetical protein